MAEGKNLARAQVTMKTLCQTLEHNDWHYDKDDEKMTIECGARGEDLPIQLTIKVDADKMLVILFSHMPFVVPKEKILEVAVAVSAVNNMLVDGCFDYDVTSGHMFFRMTNSFLESTLSEEVFSYLLYCSCGMIDKFNDKFLMLAKGMISLEQFITSMKN